MFRFRGQRAGDIGGFVIGWWYISNNKEGQNVIRCEDGLSWYVRRDTLSISTGKLDSNKQEIFASFEVDGVMTTGGDVVEVGGEHYSVLYLSDTAQFCISGESGVVCPFADLYSQNLTIIGKQGGGNEIRQN